MTHPDNLPKMSTITQEFKAHVADMIQDIINEMRNATPEQVEYLRLCIYNRLSQLIPDPTWHPIATAPKDGKVILGKWEDDPRPQHVKYSENGHRIGWFVLVGDIWLDSIPPSHWKPIN